MGSDGIVQPPPLLVEYRCLGQCVEDRSVQELVSQFAVEALVVAVLPRTARRHVEGPDPQPGQPSPHQFRRELWPVVRAQMLGRNVPSEEIREHLENVVSSSLSTDLDLPDTAACTRSEHGQKLQKHGRHGSSKKRRSRTARDSCAVARCRMHEPSLSHNRPRFGCRLGTFSPSCLQIRSTRLVVHLPALDTQQVRDLAIPVTAEPARQAYHVRA